MKIDLFDCRFHFDDIDLTDMTACRTRMVDIVNGPDFEDLVRDLAITGKQVKEGPTPRGRGECGVNGSAHSGGGWSVGGGCSWRF